MTAPRRRTSVGTGTSKSAGVVLDRLASRWRSSRRRRSCRRAARSSRPSTSWAPDSCSSRPRATSPVATCGTMASARRSGSCAFSPQRALAPGSAGTSFTLVSSTGGDAAYASVAGMTSGRAPAAAPSAGRRRRKPNSPSMLRPLFNLLSLVSALLLAAALVLWVRGYWVTDHFWLVFRDDGGEMVRSLAGRFTVRHVAPNVRTFPAPRRVTHWSCRTGSQLPPAPSPRHWQWWVFSYEGTPRATPQEIRAARATLKALEGPSPAPPADEQPPKMPQPVPGQSDDEALQALDAWREWTLKFQQRRIIAFQRLQMRDTRLTQARNLLSGTYYQSGHSPPGSPSRRWRRRPGCGWRCSAAAGSWPAAGSARTAATTSAPAASSARNAERPLLSRGVASKRRFDAHCGVHCRTGESCPPTPGGRDLAGRRR